MAHPFEDMGLVPPEVPAAAGAAPFPPGPPAPVSPPIVASTYREYYSDRSHSPPPDRIAGFLAGYRFADVANGVIPTPANLVDPTVTLSDRQPMAFLCPATGLDGVNEVMIVHRFVRFMDSPGDDPSGYHDRVLGLLGDILPHQYSVVEVPDTGFHLVGSPVRVPTVGAMNALLPTWEDATVALGPYTELDPETEVIRPRHLQVVPNFLASIIIHRRRVRAKVAYQELVGAIQAEDGLEAYSDVVAWLRAACTARGGGGAQVAIPIVVHPFAPLHLPPGVYGYMTTKVQTDLPGLAIPTPALAGPTDALVGAIQALVANRGTAEGSAERTPKEPKTIAEAYKETYKTLLRYDGNVSTVEELAPLWARLANCHKSEQHTVLTQDFQRCA